MHNSLRLQHIQRISEETEGGGLLSALSQIDEETLKLVSDFATNISGFVDRTEARIRGELAVLGDDLVDNAVERVDSHFEALQQAMPGTPNRTVT